MTLTELVTLYQKGGFHIFMKQDNFFLSRGLVNYSFPLLESAQINQSICSNLKWKFLISVIKTDTLKKNTYEYILKTDDYSIEKFKRKVRQRINKSLNTFIFKRPGLEDLIHYGLKINRQALIVQDKRRDKTLTNYNRWVKQASAFYYNKDVIVLAAYERDRMVAYIIACEYEGRYFTHLKHFDREMNNSSPMQGLIFTLINQIITEKGSIVISDGMESYKHIPELRRFKLNMLYERIPASRVYIIHPLILKFIQLLICFNIHFLKKFYLKGFYFRTLVHLYKGHLGLINSRR
jgi:hypothetical protein